MSDIATLGLRVTQVGSEDLQRSLDTIAGKGAKAEEALENVTRALKSAGSAANNTATGVNAAAVATEQSAQRSSAAVVRTEAQKQATLDRMREQSRAADVRAQQAKAEQQRAIAVTKAREQAQAVMQAMEQQLQRDQARVREDQARGFLTPAQAREAGRLNAIAYNDGVLSAITKGNAVGAFDGKSGQASYVTLAGSIKNLNEESVKATMSAGRLRESVTAMAASALHSVPGVMQFSSILGSMALGSAIMVGVMGALAAVSLAWRALTKEAKEAQKATEDAIAALEKLARTRMLGVAGELPDQIAAATSELHRLQRQIDEASKPRSIGRDMDSRGAVTTVIDQRKLADLRAQYAKAASEIKQGEAALGRTIADANASSLATLISANKATEAQRAQARATIAGDQRKLAALLKAGNQTPDIMLEQARLASEVATLTSALDGAVKKAAKSAKDAAAEHAAYERAIEAQAEAGQKALQYDHLRTLGLDGLRNATAQLRAELVLHASDLPKTIELTEQLTRAEAALAEQARLAGKDLDHRPPALGGGSGFGSDIEADIVALTKLEGLMKRLTSASIFAKHDPSVRDEILRDALEAQKVMDELWSEAVRGMQRTFAEGFKHILTDGLDGFDDFAADLTQLFVGVAAQIAAVFAAQEFGLDELLKRLKDPAFQLNLSQGAGSGALQTRVLPAVIGAGVGYQTGSPLAGIGAGALSGAALGGPVGAVLGAVGGLAGGLLGHAAKMREAAEQMRKAMDAWHKSITDASAAISETGAGAAMRQATESVRAQIKVWEDTFGDFARIDFGSFADLSALIAEMERLRDTSLSTDSSKASEWQKAIDFAKQRQVALQEEIALANRSAQDDARIRTLRAQGLEALADAEAFAIAQERELAQARREGLDPATIDAIKGAQAAERKRREEDIALSNQQAQEDYRVRALVAQGRAEEADALRLQIDQQREYQDAVRAGLDDATLAALAFAQAAEAAAAAAQKAQEAARALEDLEVRRLVAAGREQEAADRRFALEQQREREDAQSAGRSQAYMAALEFTHALERFAYEQQKWLDAQTKAIEDAAAAEQNRLDQLIDAAQSQLDVLQDQLREAERAADATRRLVENLSDFNSGLSLDPSRTTLGPIDQLAEARRQYDALLERARGGDRDAANDLPAAARALLDASRNVNASGPGYVRDFDRVRDTMERITARFRDQLTTEELALQELKKHTAALQAEIEQLRANKAAAAADADRQLAALQRIAVIERQGNASRAESDRIIASLTKLREEVDDAGRAMIDAHRDSLAGTRDALRDATDREVEAIRSGARPEIVATLAQTREIALMANDYNNKAVKQIHELAAIKGYGSDEVRELERQRTMQLERFVALQQAVKEAGETAGESGRLIAQLTKLRESLTGVGASIVDAQRDSLAGTQEALQAAMQREIEAIRDGARPEIQATLGAQREVAQLTAAYNNKAVKQITELAAIKGYGSDEVREAERLREMQLARFAALQEAVKKAGDSTVASADIIAKLRALREATIGVGRDVVDSQVDSLAATQAALAAATAAQVQAVKDGAPQELQAQLDQIAAINLMKNDYNTKATSQITELAAIKGWGSQEVAEAITQKNAYLLKYDDMIAGIGGVGGGITDLTHAIEAPVPEDLRVTQIRDGINGVGGHMMNVDDKLGYVEQNTYRINETLTTVQNAIVVAVDNVYDAIMGLGGGGGQTPPASDAAAAAMASLFRDMHAAESYRQLAALSADYGAGTRSTMAAPSRSFDGDSANRITAAVDRLERTTARSLDKIEQRLEKVKQHARASVVVAQEVGKRTIAAVEDLAEGAEVNTQKLRRALESN